jgi:hypothetical protein
MKKPPRFGGISREEQNELLIQGEERQAGANAWESSVQAQTIRRWLAQEAAARTPTPSSPNLPEVAQPREGNRAPGAARTGAPESGKSLGEADSSQVVPFAPPRLRPSELRSSNTATPSQVREPDRHAFISVDWLTVRQYHAKAPLLGDSLLLFVGLEEGEIRSQAVRGLQHRGSHDSSLQVRSDGRLVEVSGNPSKWGRFDNLYGHATVQDCIEVFNAVLRQLGLPEFTDDDRTRLAPHQYAKSDEVAPNGCTITRVDLCRNWQAGSPQAARSVVAALGSVVRMGKPGWVSPDGCTVAWGIGSRYVYTKYYLKGPELLKHPGSDPDYSARLAAWCDTVGIVRQEVSLKSMQLKRNGLDRPARWSRAVMQEQLDAYSPHRDAGQGRCSFQDLYQTLVESGVPRSRARAAQNALYAYLAGQVFEWRGPNANISRSAFYRLKSDLAVAGVDPAAPLNVATLPVRVREVSLSPAEVPDWYRWAG